MRPAARCHAETSEFRLIDVRAEPTTPYTVNNRDLSQLGDIACRELAALACDVLWNRLTS